MLPTEERKELLHTIATNFAEQFIDLDFHGHEDPVHTDKVNLYSRRLLSLGCFYLEYSMPYGRVMEIVCCVVGDI